MIELATRIVELTVDGETSYWLVGAGTETVRVLLRTAASALLLGKTITMGMPPAAQAADPDVDAGLRMLRTAISATLVPQRDDFIGDNVRLFPYDTHTPQIAG